MKVRVFAKPILWAPFLIYSAYLFTAFIWAWTITPQQFEQYRKSHGGEKNTLSEWQIEIVKKVEDPSFDTNIGLDITTPGQGATTITQSLARDVFLNQPVSGTHIFLQNIFRTMFKRFKKIDLGRDMMALALHCRIPRQALLDAFITQSYMGKHQSRLIYGLPEAAYAHYSRNITSLKTDEFITLVAMLKAPETYQIHTHANTARSSKIRQLLAEKCKAAHLFDDTYRDCGLD
jgi:membrane carboxypeptidase/penicillin-binding protein PbpC